MIVDEKQQHKRQCLSCRADSQTNLVCARPIIQNQFDFLCLCLLLGNVIKASSAANFGWFSPSGSKFASALGCSRAMQAQIGCSVAVQAQIWYRTFDCSSPFLHHTPDTHLLVKLSPADCAFRMDTASQEMSLKHDQLHRIELSARLEAALAAAHNHQYTALDVYPVHQEIAPEVHALLLTRAQSSPQPPTAFCMAAFA